jgi:hypothetical protein
VETPARPRWAKPALFLSSIFALFITALALGPTAALATQNPIAAYSFDEASGTVAHDLYGSHDGELEHAEWDSPPEWSPGKFGSALRFQGQGYQCVNVPQSPDLELQESFTIETWVKPEGSGVEEPLIFKEAPTFESHMAYMLYLGLEADGKVGGYVEEPGWKKPEVTSGKLPTGEWTHLALTFDGEHLRLYVNGNLVDTTAANGPQASKGPLKFGCAEVYGQDFEGKLDEVRIYDRALSGEEVRRDKETALETPPVSQQPVAAYSFDEGEGSVAHDLAEGRDATIEGAEWTTGKYGDALKFDGEEDCVSIPASPGLRLGEEFTLEAWAKPEGALEGDPVIFNGESSTAYALGIGLPHSGKAEGVIGEEGGGTKHLYSSASFQANVWTHLALSFDGARLRLYVNGRLVATEAVEHPDFASAGPITIGCSGVFGSHFKGRIDEVRIYNRALDGGEVAGDMGTPLQTGPAGPVASYAFDSESEPGVDTTGNEHEATLEGATWTPHGRYGGGLDFDAAEKDVVTIPASPQLDFSEEFTLEAWVRPSTAENRYAPLIVHQKTGSESQPYALYEGGWESNLPFGGIGFGTPGESYSHASEPLPQNAWSHVALTFDGAETRIYVNGKLVDEDAGSAPTVSEGNLEIGGATEQHPDDQYFDGRIDEVRLYNRALSEAEVQADKATPIQTPQQGPVAAYSFDEGEGTTLEDITGNEHEGTIEGAEWARGKYGDSLEFNGEEDCVTIPKTEDLQFSEEFTLEAWVRPEGSAEKALPVMAMNDEEAKGEEQQIAWELFAGQSEEPKAWVRKGGASGYNGVYGEEPLPQKTWSHIALTDDGAHIRLYVNGVLGKEENSTNAAPLLTAAEGPLTIGCGITNGAFSHFKGRIDEVRIYNRALASKEVADIQPPNFPSPFVLSAASLPDPFGASEDVTTTIFFPHASDPKLMNGTAGTGVASYTARYARGSESFGSWQTVSNASLNIGKAEEGSMVSIEVYATDYSGNRSEIRKGTVIIPAPLSLPAAEESEEIREPGEIGGISAGMGVQRESSFARGGAAINATGVLQSTTCELHLHFIHKSSHKLSEGKQRTNVGATFECRGDLEVVSGEAAVVLLFIPKKEPKVQFEGESNIWHFSGFPPQYEDRYANGSARFVEGEYRALAYMNCEWPAGTINVLTGVPETSRHIEATRGRGNPWV